MLFIIQTMPENERCSTFKSLKSFGFRFGSAKFKKLIIVAQQVKVHGVGSDGCGEDHQVEDLVVPEYGIVPERPPQRVGTGP